MDDRYRDYYRNVFEGAAEWPGILPRSERPASFDDGREVRRIVSELSSELELEHGLRLREDAQLLLFLNSWQMIVRPVIEVREGERDALFDDLREDLREIVLAAADEGSAGGTPLGEVSGHRVVDALSGRWSELRLTKWRVWE